MWYTTEEIAKRTAKDSVFTDLFQDPKYLIQLYHALHPEDQDVTVESISNVTIKNILLDQCYNDLGVCIGDKLVILVEAQILKTYVASKEKDAAEAGAYQKAKSTALKLYKKGNSVEDIADSLEVSVKEVEEWLGLVLA